jgi:hypothetical protein
VASSYPNVNPKYESPQLYGPMSDLRFHCAIVQLLKCKPPTHSSIAEIYRVSRSQSKEQISQVPYERLKNSSMTLSLPLSLCFYLCYTHSLSTSHITIPWRISTLWLSGCELQPITFNLHFISDLQVSTRYHQPGLPLAQWSCNPWLPWMNISYFALGMDEKRASWSSQGMAISGNQQQWAGYLSQIVLRHPHLNHIPTNQCPLSGYLNPPQLFPSNQRPLTGYLVQNIKVHLAWWICAKMNEYLAWCICHKLLTILKSLD